MATKAKVIDVTVPAQGWRMHYIQGSSRKFYEVILTESNFVILRWGRIGTAGQSSATRYGSYSDANDVALRQVYSKRSKGYDSQVSEFAFAATENAISYAAQGDAGPIGRELSEAIASGEFDGSKAVVLKHYQDFSNRAQRLLAQADEMDFDQALSEFDALEAVFAEITSKHEEVSTSMGLVRATLMQKLMAGSLNGHVATGL